MKLQQLYETFTIIVNACKLTYTSLTTNLTKTFKYTYIIHKEIEPRVFPIYTTHFYLKFRAL